MSNKTIHKPHTVMRIRTGVPAKSDHDMPKRLPCGVPERIQDNEWVTHPAWSKAIQYGNDGQPVAGPTEFIIELASNVLDYTFQSHLACHLGAKPFCFRAHRGDDGIGVAKRQWVTGAMVPAECDPTRCALRQQALQGGHDKLIMSEYGEAYRYASFMVGKQVAKCNPYNFLLFRLLLPDGSGYAHPSGELCYLSTHSEVTHGRMRDKLRRMYADAGGQLKGVRVRLAFRPFRTSHRKAKDTPGWSIEQLDGAEHELNLEAAIRRRQVDYDAIAAQCTDAESTALVLADIDNHLAHWQALSPATIEREQAAAFELLDRQAVDAQYINPATVTLVNQHPTVRALAERLQRPYAYQVRYGMQYTDAYTCIKALVDHNAGQVYIDDIIAASEYAAAFTHGANYANGGAVGAVHTPAANVMPVPAGDQQQPDIPQSTASEAEPVGAPDAIRSAQEFIAAAGGQVIDAEYTESDGGTFDAEGFAEALGDYEE